MPANSSQFWRNSLLCFQHVGNNVCRPGCHLFLATPYGLNMALLNCLYCGRKEFTFYFWMPWDCIWFTRFLVVHSSSLLPLLAWRYQKINYFYFSRYTCSKVTCCITCYSDFLLLEYTHIKSVVLVYFCQYLYVNCCLLGLGDPASFYVAVIFLLNGVMMSLFFIYGTYLR